MLDNGGNVDLTYPKLQDPRLQSIQLNNYAALGLLPPRPNATTSNRANNENTSNYPNGLSVNTNIPNSSESRCSNSPITPNQPNDFKRKPGRPKKRAGSEKAPAPKAKKLSVDTSKPSAAVAAEPPQDSNSPPKRFPRRDLLTESEKRVNHVVSEQRRRKLIREGFQVLVDLTPALSSVVPTSTGPGNTSGQHSKSTVLFKAADYIRELKQQVEFLTAQLQNKHTQLHQLHDPSSFQIQQMNGQANHIQQPSNLVQIPAQSNSFQSSNIENQQRRASFAQNANPQAFGFTQKSTTDQSFGNNFNLTPSTQSYVQTNVPPPFSEQSHGNLFSYRTQNNATSSQNNFGVSNFSHTTNINSTVTEPSTSVQQPPSFTTPMKTNSTTPPSFFEQQMNSATSANSFTPKPDSKIS
ncbi:hypothetical protein BC833DRAFT_578549 [Globomyces pollinis-pini]|nr:hypothetical protein BC833DRAFT_578549 [Globomyces pollinis-pini]